jgi:hypothetical protein
LRLRGSTYESWALSSIADPDSLDPDPNVLMTKNWGKTQTKQKCTLFFLSEMVTFALLDPDPGTPLNTDPIRIHNTGFLVHKDPDPVFTFSVQQCGNNRYLWKDDRVGIYNSVVWSVDWLEYGKSCQ